MRQCVIPCLQRHRATGHPPSIPSVPSIRKACTYTTAYNHTGLPIEVHRGKPGQMKQGHDTHRQRDKVNTGRAGRNWSA